MEILTLQGKIRDTSEKLSDLRSGKADGTRYVPAVVYGHGIESTPVKVSYSDILRVYRVAGHSSLVDLTIDKNKYNVIISDVQIHSVTEQILHVDFYAVKKGEAVQTTITLSFIGTSPAEKEGCVIEKPVHEITVKCLPKDLIHEFKVDLSKLAENGSSIHVSDIGINEKKYTLITASDVVVASAHLARGAATEESTEEVAEDDITETEEN